MASSMNSSASLYLRNLANQQYPTGRHGTTYELCRAGSPVPVLCVRVANLSGTKTIENTESPPVHYR